MRESALASELTRTLGAGQRASPRTGRKGWLAGRRWRKLVMPLVGAAILVVFVVIAAFAPLLAPYDPLASDLRAARTPPGGEHLLGTDLLGRDVLSRLMYGARWTFVLGVGSVGLAFLVALPLGVTAGYRRGRVDLLIMRFVDLGLTFPTILLALLLITILEPGVRSLILALAVSAIFPYARLTRSAVITVREQEFIVAAQSIGCSSMRVVLRHLLPNGAGPIIVHSTFEFPRVILAGAGLSFLGLGVQKPTPEWGSMIAEARSYMAVAPYLSITPGIAIMAVVVGFNLFGDGLRDYLDPKTRTF